MSRQRGRRPGRNRFLVAAAVIAAIAGIVLLYLGGRWLEQKSYQPETRSELIEVNTDESIVQVGGKSYRLRQNLTSILLMGIDRSTEDSMIDDYRHGGQADFQRLVVIDDSSKTVQQLKIDRDTLADIAVLGVFGDYFGTTRAQISLAHGFGDGKELSCKLAVKAVSRLLLNAPVDFYIAMNLDGISALNDLAGGVTVTLEDDFSHIDPAMVKGRTMTLVGDQAEIFVRTRMSIGVGTNEARMRRQEQYLDQLYAQLEQKFRQNQNFVGTVYDELSPYLVTDLARGRLVNEAWAAKDYTVLPTVEIDGKHQVAEDGFMEFHADPVSIQDAVLTLFYEPLE